MKSTLNCYLFFLRFTSFAASNNNMDRDTQQLLMGKKDYLHQEIHWIGIFTLYCPSESANYKADPAAEEFILNKIYGKSKPRAFPIDMTMVSGPEEIELVCKYELILMIVQVCLLVLLFFCLYLITTEYFTTQTFNILILINTFSVLGVFFLNLLTSTIYRKMTFKYNANTSGDDDQSIIEQSIREYYEKYIQRDIYSKLNLADLLFNMLFYIYVIIIPLIYVHPIHLEELFAFIFGAIITICSNVNNLWFSMLEPIRESKTNILSQMLTFLKNTNYTSIS